MGSINALGTTVFSLGLGRLSSWRGFFVSLLLAMLAFGLLLATGAWLAVAAACFLLGAYNVARPMATSIVSARVPEHQRGMAYALLDTISGLAAVTATNLAGVLYTEEPEWPFRGGIAGVIGVIVLGTLLLRLPRRNRAALPAYIQVEQSGK
jgi:MFS family permease